MQGIMHTENEKNNHNDNINKLYMKPYIINEECKFACYIQGRNPNEYNR